MAELGLALGGGGARGLAHIGVLKILDRERISIQSITGCSMGSIIGGLYALLKNAKEVEDFVLDIVKDTKFQRFGIQKFQALQDNSSKNTTGRIFDYLSSKLMMLKAINNQSLFNEKETDVLFESIPDFQIESLPIKFSAITTDLLSGEEINLREGSLRTAIKASSAIPGIFPPVILKDFYLIDGSASESVPVNKVKELGADRVVAVDVIKNLNSMKNFTNSIDIVYRAEEISTYYLSQERLEDADLIIRPAVKEISWASFNNIKQIIAEGEIATERMLPEIKKLISKHRFFLVANRYLKRLSKY